MNREDGTTYKMEEIDQLKELLLQFKEIKTKLAVVQHFDPSYSIYRIAEPANTVVNTTLNENINYF